MPKKLSINDMYNVATERGGKCLSNIYINNSSKLKWQCSVGHIWEATPSNVRARHWCPYCAGQGKLQLNQLSKLAKDRGGKCLSHQYINSKSKLKWECAEGHKWETSAGSINAGQWCPDCSSGVSERICRIFFESIFKEPFPKSRPRWLRSQQGTLFELDGYSEKLKIAFEHHGEQHYGRIGFYADEHTSRQLQNRDKLKRILCRKNGVILFEIPQIGNRVKIKDLKKFILNLAGDHQRLKPLLMNTPSDINYFAAYLPSSRALFQELIEIASAKGGMCLSKQYRGALVKLKWSCAKGHVWYRTPTSIKKGKSCWKCTYETRAENMRLNRFQLDNLAAKRGGRCISSVYKTAHDILEWECAEGHIWQARTNDIQQGKWCPTCWDLNRRKKFEHTLALALEFAKENGGLCLSSSIEPPRYYANWRCAVGHEWRARLHQISSGSWCKKCLRVCGSNIK